MIFYYLKVSRVISGDWIVLKI